MTSRDGVGSGLHPSFVRGVSIFLMVVATILVWRVCQGPPDSIPITDFGRDLLGADAVRGRLDPYQTVGELAPLVPGWELPPEANDHWVAHSPLAIVFAAGWSSLFGASSEAAFEVVSWVSLLLVLTWLTARMSELYSIWGGLAVAAATAMSFGLAAEMWYLGGASLAALGLIGAYELEGSRRRLPALALLGVLIAWRPWLLPVAFFLPNRRSLWRDIAAIGGVAIILTSSSAWWMGGYQIVLNWISTALPGNLEQVRPWPLNMSILGGVGQPEVSFLIFGGVLVAFLAVSRFVDRSRWWLLAVMAVLVGSPVVWPQYWLNLTPLIAVGLGSASLVILVFALLLLSGGIAGASASIAQVSVVVFCVIAGVVAIRSHPFEKSEVGSPSSSNQTV